MFNLEGSDCCTPGKLYATCQCSPPVSNKTKAVLSLTSFQEDINGGSLASCDDQYHTDNLPYVALFSGWFNSKKWCLRNITANGRSVLATVIDERDSTMACNVEYGYLPPHPNNIVAASKAACRPSGYVSIKKPAPRMCKDCCKAGKLYPTYQCSPPVSSNTSAVLTLTSFESNVDGCGLTSCDCKDHSDSLPYVALSTGWFNRYERCLHKINITANGRSVVATVIEECDSTVGCDADNAYQPPCANNLVASSKAVWKALGVPEDDWDNLDITWSDI
ncbi:hypothetical protein RJ641_016041 [Dillenia turbinata]|uniref:Uncharacterized protein n=1 Tax=Dillenia turbinata TaxID=194707 RepID=A0AAN8V034_9MAGN